MLGETIRVKRKRNIPIPSIEKIWTTHRRTGSAGLEMHTVRKKDVRVVIGYAEFSRTEYNTYSIHSWRNGRDA